jgi:hypothetical protein
MYLYIICNYTDFVRFYNVLQKVCVYQHESQDQRIESGNHEDDASNEYYFYFC